MGPLSKSSTSSSAERIFAGLSRSAVFFDGSDLIFEIGWCYRLRPVSGLYVHPVTGLLRYAKRATPAAAEPEPNLVRVNSNVEYEKIGGYWYGMEYEEAVSSEGASIRVLVLKRQCDRRTTQRIERGDFGVPARKHR